MMKNVRKEGRNVSYVVGREAGASQTNISTGGGTLAELRNIYTVTRCHPPHPCSHSQSREENVYLGAYPKTNAAFLSSFSVSMLKWLRPKRLLYFMVRQGMVQYFLVWCGVEN